MTAIDRKGWLVDNFLCDCDGAGGCCCNKKLKKNGGGLVAQLSVIHIHPTTHMLGAKEIHIRPHLLVKHLIRTRNPARVLHIPTDHKTPPGVGESRSPPTTSVCV